MIIIYIDAYFIVLCTSADPYYAVELISVIKASRVITIEGKSQSPTVTSSTHNADDPLPHP